MGKTTREGSNDAGKRGSWRPITSVGVLASATAVAVGLLISIYQATDRSLFGPRFLIAIALAGCAVPLIVEGANRARRKMRWLPALTVGVLVELLSLVVVLVPASSGDAPAGDGGLRLSLRQTGPELFQVAFRGPIPWPAKEEGWSELHRRGGIDVRDSHFRMILANEGRAPISVLSVRVEVLGSGPIPHGTLAWRYSQGDEGVGELAALLPDGKRGSVAKLYRTSGQPLDPEHLSELSPYFQTRYILLKPGEVYPVRLTIQADTPRTISYRLTAEGESADRHYVVHSPVHRVVGRFDDPYQTLFARYYAKGHDPSACTPTPDNPWVDARNSDRFSACPHGLGHSYEVRPPSSSRYPPGDFRLRLGLALGRQEAAIDGVLVGKPPAAASRSNVVRPLLNSLGAWDRCSEYAPSTDLWTADWFRWGLKMIFTSEAHGDCTPASRAGVREIHLAESHLAVETELGEVQLGGLATDLPSRLRRLAPIAESDEFERIRVAPGSSPCDPSTETFGYQLGGERVGGIIALGESPYSQRIDALTTTLPSPRC